MLDFPLMVQMKLPFVDRIHTQSNMFTKVIENKATGDWKLTCNDSPGDRQFNFTFLTQGTHYLTAVKKM